MLLQSAPTLIPGSTVNAVLPEIQIHGQNYEVKTGNDVRDASVLQVALVRRHPDLLSTKPRFQQFKLSGHGQYRSAAIALPPELRENHDSIAALITAIFQTAYSWLEQEVGRLFASPEVALGAEMYRHIRSLLSKTGSCSLK
jgi:hypothetical protein